MTDKSLEDFYDKRQGNYVKVAEKEDFFLEMNKTLHEREQAYYQDYPIEEPFIFIFGAPRSGTTLLSQLLSASLDCGYINNLIARFWLAPIHGVRLSKAMFGSGNYSSFNSDYARTSEIQDIHEFGYFWRDLLNKENMSDITQVRERESVIDWNHVRRVLSSIQHEFGKPMVFKNIFGSYHLEKLKALLGRVVYVYIERDPLDSAISILQARKKYYSDLNTWWSYTPIEYDELKDLDYMEQIAGQVYFLQRFYQKEIEKHADCSIKIRYEELARNPQSVLRSVQEKAREFSGNELTLAQSPPESFPFRTYLDRPDERQAFKTLMDKFAQSHP